MKVFLGLIGIAAFIAALGSCAMAKTAVHEIGAIVVLLIGVVALGLAAVIEEIQRIGKHLSTNKSNVPTLTDDTSKARDNVLKMAE